MQQIGYASAAWNDIKNSPGWFGKIAVLALLQFVPIFGQIVLFGYIYGWARDIAWGVHAPLPERIFGNEDGKLFSRGAFVFVLLFVLMLVPTLVGSIGTAPAAALGNHADGRGLAVGLFAVFGLSGLVSLALFLACMVVFAVGAMRIAIYDRISAGFQLKKIWAMLSHDSNGALRIFGMAVLLGLVGSLAFTMLASLVSLAVFAVSLPGIASLDALDNITNIQVFSTLGPSLGVWVLLMLVVGFVAEMYFVFLYLMVARASGYWTQQFGVAQWRGQDDPMPFEVAQMQQDPYQPYPPAGTGV